MYVIICNNKYFFIKNNNFLYHMKAKEVLNLLKITRQILWRYVKEGKINVTQCVNGQYIYNKDDVYNIKNCYF